MRMNPLFRNAAVAVCLIVSADNAFSQTNKPAATSQVPAPSGSVATTPAQYTSGLKVNYVRTYEAMGPYTTVTSFDSAATSTDGYKHVKEATQYLDGLGR